MQNQATNVVIFLADDLGYSDIGGYGGEIRTPNLDRLANQGVKLSNFHNTPRCSPSRASLLTGIHPHQTGIGILLVNLHLLRLLQTKTREKPNAIAN